MKPSGRHAQERSDVGRQARIGDQGGDERRAFAARRRRKEAGDIGERGSRRGTARKGIISYFHPNPISFRGRSDFYVPSVAPGTWDPWGAEHRVEYVQLGR